MKNSMYTTAQSIENKVGGLSGWKDLLQAVGFRFEPSTNGLPPAVFFPQSDPAERLTQASASLQAILGLPHGSFVALAKFLASYEAGEAMIRVVSRITQIFWQFLTIANSVKYLPNINVLQNTTQDPIHVIAMPK